MIGFRLSAQLRDGVAHGGEVDDGGNAGKVLHQDAGRAILDFTVDAAIGQEGGERLHILLPHRIRTILEPQHVFEEHLHGEGQAVEIAELLRRRGERIIGEGRPFTSSVLRVPSVSLPICVMRGVVSWSGMSIYRRTNARGARAGPVCGGV